MTRLHRLLQKAKTWLQFQRMVADGGHPDLVRASLLRLAADRRDQQLETALSQGAFGDRFSEALTRLLPEGQSLRDRLRGYDLVALNVKQLGYALGMQLAGRIAARKVAAPPGAQLPSCLCRQQDFESDWLLYWCEQIQSAPLYHRKLWEYCYVVQALWAGGKLRPGSQGVGFGIGEEPLPSLFARYGASVMATDLSPEADSARGWIDSNQHGSRAETLRRRDICDDAAKLAQIDFRFVDMNAIPADFAGRFDFCWSACALEHVGSIALGLDFIENSLATLKPGGLAVHTTEYNLSDGPTIDSGGTVLFQRHHLEEIADRLRRKGFRVAPLDLSPGDQVLDGFVDLPPFLRSADGVPLLDMHAHLRLSIWGHPCTSVGLIIEKPL